MKMTKISYQKCVKVGSFKNVARSLKLSKSTGKTVIILRIKLYIHICSYFNIIIIK